VAGGIVGGVGSWVERRASITPDRVAIVHGPDRWTYRELARRVQRVARSLEELGVDHGDRVVWLGANHPAFLEVFFATAKVGAILAPVNHRLDESVANALVADYAAKVAVVRDDVAGTSLSGVRTRIAVGNASGSDVPYGDLLANTSEASPDAAVSFDDVCLLPHTSGTTGVPKGVMLTHGNIAWNVANLLSLVDVVSDDVTIAIAPFFRTGGTGVNVLPVLFKGGTVVIPESSSPDEILRLLEERRVTVGFGNPDLLDALVREARWQSADLTSIRCFITGGAPVSDRLLRTYMERGVPLFQGYGLSEAAPFVSLLDPPTALRKIGSAGKPPMFVDIRTVRPDGTTCAPNETGELLVRGPNVMIGYWNREDATRTTIDDEGWLHTGDAARIDDEGDAWIVDRIADAYESAGQLVFPGDVERAIGQHPSVEDVGIGTRDGVRTAFVVLRPEATTTEGELLELCRTALPLPARPGAIVFVDELPRNSVGKLLRHQL
jgi:fatty-acyl-CoA synthase